MTDAVDMTPDMSPDESLALEWALGVLDQGMRAAAEARRQADPAFAALCAHWAASLSPLSDDVEPQRPSRAVWDAIEAEIAPAAFTPTDAAAERPYRARWWDNLAIWRGATAGFAALALALFALPVRQGAAPVPPSAPVPEQAPAPEPAPQPIPAALLATTLAAEGGAPLATASLDPDRRQVVVSPLGTADPDGRVPELWLIPADGKPRSLGIISLGGAQRIQVPETILQLVADGATLAVSLEPVGGSPTGQPTGPVVATGKLATI